MTTLLTIPTAHRELLRNVLQRPLTEEDALLWMVLLHTHAIHLSPGVLAEEAIVLSAETQRGVASIIADLWPDRADERSNDAYWYRQYNTRTPYEVLEDVPRDLLSPILRLREILSRDPRVSAIIEDS